MTARLYRPARLHARLAVWVLLATVILDVLDFVITYADHELLVSLDRGDFVSASDLSTSDARLAAISWAQIGLRIATAAAFISWLYRVYHNLAPLGAAELRFAPGWAIGSWFVPFLNFYRPKQIVNDVWRGSDPALPRTPGLDWRTGSVPGFFALWWLIFLVSGWIAVIFVPALDGSGSISDLQTQDRAWMAQAALDALAALLAVVVVRRTTRRQQARAQRVTVVDDVRPLAPVHPQNEAEARLAAELREAERFGREAAVGTLELAVARASGELDEERLHAVRKAAEALAARLGEEHLASRAEAVSSEARAALDRLQTPPD